MLGRALGALGGFCVVVMINKVGPRYWGRAPHVLVSDHPTAAVQISHLSHFLFFFFIVGLGTGEKNKK